MTLKIVNKNNSIRIGHLITLLLLLRMTQTLMLLFEMENTKI